MCFETTRPINCTTCGRTYTSETSPELCPNAHLRAAASVSAPASAPAAFAASGSCGSITRPRELPARRAGRCLTCVRNCEDCNEFMAVVEIDASGHVRIEPVEGPAATCGRGGAGPGEGGERADGKEVGRPSGEGRPAERERGIRWTLD